jgi:Calcineurin-like phosphoesterase
VSKRRKQLATGAAFAALFITGITSSTFVTASSVAAGDPVIVAAGDICANSGGTDCAASASLIGAINPDAVLTLGDNSYPDGSLSDYQGNYAPQWGQYNAKAYPSPGNHDFHVTGAQGYLDYFGSRAPGYMYSYDLGSWHLVSLPGDVLSGSAPSISQQNTWLQNDLTAHQGQCILAYWHEPRFSSGTIHGDDTGVGPLWTTLYNNHAAVVLNGHEHNYERFEKQNPSGVADPNGIREFVAGIGGADQGSYPFGTPDANSEVRGQVDGVLKLTLHPTGYDWQVVPNAGQTFTDAGSDTCPGVTQPPPTTSTTTPTTSATTPTTTTNPAPTGTPPFRYIYNSGADQAGAASNGWNLLDVGSKSTADALPAGTQGLVWVGDYDNSTCAFEQSDATVTSIVTSTRGDPKVFGYFFSDEPNPFACPNAPTQHKARSDLIHAADPNTKTVMVVDSNSGTATLNQIPLWKGDADYIGLDPYPCLQSNPCDYGWIDQVIAAADSAGLDYWGVVQAFNDATWRYPTTDELNHMLTQWSASAETGQMTFAWVWTNGGSGSAGISSNLPLLSAYSAYNSGTSPPPSTTSTTTPTTTIVPTTTTSPDPLQVCRDKLTRINAEYHSADSRLTKLTKIHNIIHETGLCAGFSP